MQTKTIEKLSRLTAVAIILMMFFSLLAACTKIDETDFGKIPKVDLSNLGTKAEHSDLYFIRQGVPVNLLDYVSGDKNAEIDFRLNGVAAEEKDGYDADAKIWTPIRQGEFKLMLKASNATSYNLKEKTVTVAAPSEVYLESKFQEVLDIDDSVNFHNAFKLSAFIKAEVSATIVYDYEKEDGSQGVKEEVINVYDKAENNPKATFNSQTAIYTFKHYGTHRVHVTMFTGLGKVEKDFQFEIQKPGTVHMIEYLDDLLGKGSNGDPEFVGGKIQQNPRLSYRLTRDLDFEDPASWKDGVIKEFVPISAKGTRTDMNAFAGTIDGLKPDGSGNFTIKNFSNRFGNNVNKTIFTLIETRNAGGTIKNLNLEVKYEIKAEDIEGEITRNIKVSPVFYDSSSGNSATVLNNVHTYGTITINGEKAESDRVPLQVAGLAISATEAIDCTSSVNITLKNMRCPVGVGGLIHTARSGNIDNYEYGQFRMTSALEGKKTYQGNIVIEMAENKAISVGGIMAGFSSGTKVEGLSSAGIITIKTIQNPVSPDATVQQRIDAKSHVVTAGAIAGSSSADTVTNCYSDMTLKFNNLTSLSTSGELAVGGLIGKTSLSIVSSIYSGEIIIDDLNNQAQPGTLYEGTNAGIGGISGIFSAYEDNQKIVDNIFDGEITVKGSGHKLIGGIGGAVTGPISTFQNNVVSGTFNITDGTVTFGGLLGFYHSANNTVISGGLYAGKVNAINVAASKKYTLIGRHPETWAEIESEEDVYSIYGGIIGKFDIGISNGASTAIKGVEIYGNLGNSGDGSRKALAIGWLTDINRVVPKNLPNGLTTINVENGYDENYEQTDFVKVSSTRVNLATAQNAQLGLTIKNLRHDIALTGTDLLIGLPENQDIGALIPNIEIMIENYIKNVSIDYQLFEIGTAHQGWINITSKGWENKSYNGIDNYYIVEIEGKTYLRLPDRTYNYIPSEFDETIGSEESEIATESTVGQKATKEQREASIQLMRNLIEDLKAMFGYEAVI